MKGITPVIAIILLLLITISMVGFAFVWFSRVTSSAGSQIENSTFAELRRQGQRITIENINPSAATVTVRNSGTVSIADTELALYTNNVLLTPGCTWSPTSIAPGARTTCDFNSSACATGTTVKVVAPGGQDLSTC